MRRVPEWLPEVIAWRNPYNRSRMGGAVPLGISVFSMPEPPPTRMDLVVYQSQSIINGLLMTKVIMDRNWNDPNRNPRVERFFFGYRCGGCGEVFLVRNDARQVESLDRSIFHDCDPSDIRRAVRNARELARERGEYIMEGMNGERYPEKFYRDIDHI